MDGAEGGGGTSTQFNFTNTNIRMKSFSLELTTLFLINNYTRLHIVQSCVFIACLPPKMFFQLGIRLKILISHSLRYGAVARENMKFIIVL